MKILDLSEKLKLIKKKRLIKQNEKQTVGWISDIQGSLGIINITNVRI